MKSLCFQALRQIKKYRKKFNKNFYYQKKTGNKEGNSVFERN